jgi:hypothetical protein
MTSACPFVFRQALTDRPPHLLWFEADASVVALRFQSTDGSLAGDAVGCEPVSAQFPC